MATSMACCFLLWFTVRDPAYLASFRLCYTLCVP